MQKSEGEGGNRIVGKVGSNRIDAGGGGDI